MSGRRTTFDEVMEGTIRLTGEDRDRPMRLELSADLPEVLRLWGDTEGALRGRARVKGWADDSAATGRMRVAPVAARQIRYTLDFTAADGRRLHLDGWKSTTPRRPIHSMTYLPATVTDDDGKVVGEARLRFHLRRDLARFLATFRFPRSRPERDHVQGERAEGDRVPGTRAEGGRVGGGRVGGGRVGGGRVRGGRVRGRRVGGGRGPGDLMESRWRGQPGRLEVWYTTLTDPATGTGVWLHHELVAPSDGGEARKHGWAAVFPPGETPVFGRFESYDQRLSGKAGEVAWDLTDSGGGQPMYTFPRWAWERELLPAAQVVPKPTATYDGTVRFGDRTLELRGARGGSAHIYGHGNAKRWVWMHADLGGGDVCEVVAAVSMRPGLNRLPALPFVRLRMGGVDWPGGDPLLAALRLRADLGLPTWTVWGRVGDRRIHIQVTQHPEETLSVDYADPDGAPAVCHNSERADVHIVVSRRTGKSWAIEREWRLEGTGHAEVGTR